jgi:cysteine synthase A
MATPILTGAASAIGRTPLITLGRIHDGPGRIVAKAEFLQPGGSVKDRAALAVIEAARASGALSPGHGVVEMTSGNMGAGLAVVCNSFGHPLTVTMSAGNSRARAIMMRDLGADVRLVPQVDGKPGQVTGADIAAAADEARMIADETGGFLVDQFNNPAVVAAHERGTGPEILADLGVAPTAFVAAVGTGGTFLGSGRALKRADARVFCAAVEPATTRPLAGMPVRGTRHLLQGTGYGDIPPLWDAAVMDAAVSVDDETASIYRVRLATHEGLYVGYSSAANVAAAVALLESGRIPRDSTVATILCDTGLKYIAP